MMSYTAISSMEFIRRVPDESLSVTMIPLIATCSGPVCRPALKRAGATPIVPVIIGENKRTYFSISLFTGNNVQHTRRVRRNDRLRPLITSEHIAAANEPLKHYIKFNCELAKGQRRLIAFRFAQATVLTVD